MIGNERRVLMIKQTGQCKTAQFDFLFPDNTFCLKHVISEIDYYS